MPSKVGEAHSVKGGGMFVSGDPDYVVTNYSHGANDDPTEPLQALVKYEFDEADVLSGKLTDVEPEISINNATLVETKILGRNGEKVTK